MVRSFGGNDCAHSQPRVNEKKRKQKKYKSKKDVANSGKQWLKI